MKKIFLLVLILCSFNLMAQPNVKEEVYLQLSSTDLIVGETLKFSAFTRSQYSGNLSNLSKVLYVELLDENNEPVYQTKLIQNNGRSAGSFFISTNLSTGNYHLIAYTRWMKNFKEYFYQRIEIVNPYRSWNFQKGQSNDLKIEFYPEGGTLIDGFQNNVVMHATNLYLKGVPVIGKIVSNKGVKIIDVNSDQFGFFKFSIHPRASENYQFILEMDSSFSFFDLPKAEKGVRIKISNEDEQLSIDLKSTGITQNDCRMAAYKGYDLYDAIVDLNGTNVPSELGLIEGLNQIKLKKEFDYKRWLIVSDLGKKIADYAFSQPGCFEFQLRPNSSENFQLILETDSSFQYFKIPKTKIELQLSIPSKGKLLVVNLNSKAKDDRGCMLSFYKNGINIQESNVDLNDELKLDKSSLPEGLIQVILKADKTYSRWIWNNTKKELSNDDLTFYHPLSVINHNLNLPDSANYSISINRKNGAELNSTIGQMNEINNAIKLKQGASFFKQASIEQIDNLLIASKNIKISNIPKSVKLLPEYRYGIVQGKLLNSEEFPIYGKKLALVFPGVEQHISVTRSDSSGNFTLRYDPKKSYNGGSVHVLDSLKSNYKIVLEREFYTSYPKFINPIIRFDSLKIANILKRSINNQLENAFYDKSAVDSLEIKYAPFQNSKSYYLDDYTRFSTMRDTFIEIIPELGVSKNEKNYKIRMRIGNEEFGVKSNEETLFLIDGIFATEKDIFSLPPTYVERIDVLNQRYFFGKIQLNGILAIHTNNHDGLNSNKLGKQIDLAQAHPIITTIKTEFNPRSPNLNTLLYWNPIVEHDTGIYNLKFNTNDVIGTYEIRVDGVDKNGIAISIREYFEVK